MNASPPFPAMEPTKHAALMVCLRQSQVDVAIAKREKDAQIERAARAEAEVAKLRAVIDASGSDNVRRIVQLQDEVERKSRNVAILEGTTRIYVDTIATQDRQIIELENRNATLRNITDDLSNSHTKVATIARGIQEGRDKYMELWLQEMQGRIDAERSDRRNKMYLKRARKSRNKAQRRLYALRAKVRRAENAA